MAALSFIIETYHKDLNKHISLKIIISTSFYLPSIEEKRSGYYGNLGSLRAGTRHHGDFSVMGTSSLQPFLKSYWLTPVK